jgi:hypothetical protein
MFAGATSFNQPIGSWGSVGQSIYASTTDHMFDGASSFNQTLASWYLPDVTDISYMFANASSFNSPPPDFNNAANFEGLFQNAVSFNYDFGSELGDGYYGGATNMNYMFDGATVFNQDLTAWCVQFVTELPTDFATGSALSPSNYPVWGTCPV